MKSTKSLSITLVLFCLACGDTAQKNQPVVNNSANNGGGNNTSRNNGGQNNGNNTQNNTVDMGSGTIDFGNDDDGPQILDVSSSPGRMTEGESVTILAQVTDAQGFDDIGGGRITDLDGTVYANFSGSGGAYQATLTWQQLNAIEPINFDSETSTTFIAEFFDTAGHISKETFSMTLHCSGGSACAGTCGLELCGNACMSDSDYTTTQHCGSCGNACSGDGVCNAGECVDVGRYLVPCTNDRECQDDGLCETWVYQNAIEVSLCTYECRSNSDCPGASCLQGVCAVDCTNNQSVCPEGQGCFPLLDNLSVCVLPF